LLGARAVLASKRLTSIEDTLGAIVCGADNRCLGVLSAAEVDARGDLNTTRLASGRLLVGSGGANDIASCADEVVVLASSAEQLVDRVAYITSPGARVTRIITPDAVLAREGAQHPWRVEEAWSDARAVAERCPFSLDVATARTAPLPSAREAKRFNAITQRESSDIHHARAHA
jgi:acyl CoA:acetate/3-ketoacid CoA transferase beta subunit